MLIQQELSSGTSRMEEIDRRIKEFKLNHELLLKKAKENPFTTNFEKPSGRQTSDTSSVLKILEIECIIMPVSFELSSFNSQHALVANYLTRVVEIGFIESHGALWKIIQRKDASPGIRAIIQASEIGETVFYLDSNMNLVKDLNNAAVWNIKLLNIDSQIVDAESGIPPGAVIQFELLDANKSNDAMGALTSSSSPLLLAFETVAGGGASKPVIIEQQQQQDGKQNLLLPSQQPQPQKQVSYSQNSTDSKGQLVTQVLAWEVVPDSWISDDFSFLEGHM